MMMLLLVVLILPMTAFAESALVKLLPNETSFMLKAKSIKMIYEQAKVTPSSVFGMPAREFKEIQKALKMNPFLLSELTKHGVDVTGEIAIFGGEIEVKGDDVESATIFLALPVTDGQKVIDLIKKLIKEEGEKVTYEQKGALTIIKGKRAKERAYFINSNGYLMMGINPEKDPKVFIEKLVSKSNSLGGEKLFKKLAVSISSESDLNLYINSKQIMDRNHDAIYELFKSEMNADELAVFGKDLSMLKAYQAAMISANFSTKDLSIKAGVSIKPGSIVDQLMSDIKIDKSVTLNMPEFPVTLFHLGLNVQKIYNALEKPLNLTKELAGMNAALGIDFKKDIVDLLTGSFGFGLYDGSSTAIISYNAALTIGVNNEKNAAKLLDTFLAKAPKGMISQITVNGVLTHQINVKGMLFFLAVHKGNIVAAMGKGNFKNALTGDKSFMGKMSNNGIKSQLKDPQVSLLYICIDEALKMANNLAPKKLDQAAVLVEKIKQIKHAIFTASYKNGVISTNIDVKTTFKGSYVDGILDLIKTAHSLKH